MSMGGFVKKDACGILFHNPDRIAIAIACNAESRHREPSRPALIDNMNETPDRS